MPEANLRDTNIIVSIISILKHQQGNHFDALSKAEGILLTNNTHSYLVKVSKCIEYADNACGIYFRLYVCTSSILGFEDGQRPETYAYILGSA